MYGDDDIYFELIFEFRVDIDDDHYKSVFDGTYY